MVSAYRHKKNVLNFGAFAIHARLICAAASFRSERDLLSVHLTNAIASGMAKNGYVETLISAQNLVLDQYLMDCRVLSAKQEIVSVLLVYVKTKRLSHQIQLLQQHLQQAL